MEELSIRTDGAILGASYSPGAGRRSSRSTARGAGTRDYCLYQHLHDLLPPLGIGVVTLDRRGEGRSTGDVSRGRFEVQAKDALAPLAASMSDRIRFVVGLASTGVTPSEQMMYAVAQQLERAGYGSATVRRALRSAATTRITCTGARRDARPSSPPS